MTRKRVIYACAERSHTKVWWKLVAFFSTDLWHIFISIVGKELWVMLRGNGPHEPEFSFEILRIHFLMIYTDPIEYNIVGNTKAPLLRCSPFISMLMAGDLISAGQYLNYQTFSHLQFRALLKNSPHSNHIDLKNTSGGNIPFVSVCITRFVLMFREASSNHF